MADWVSHLLNVAVTGDLPSVEQVSNFLVLEEYMGNSNSDF